MSKDPDTIKRILGYKSCPKCGEQWYKNTPIGWKCYHCGYRGEPKDNV